jgi:hypothetical protein
MVLFLGNVLIDRNMSVVIPSIFNLLSRRCYRTLCHVLKNSKKYHIYLATAKFYETPTEIAIC